MVEQYTTYEVSARVPKRTLESKLGTLLEDLLCGNKGKMSFRFES